MPDIISTVDLSDFPASEKIPWEQRAERIRKKFPITDQYDWNSNLASDVDLFGKFIRDILKLEQATPGRPGPRPSLDVTTATKRLQQLFGNDYTILKFSEALKVLIGDRSIRNVAHKTGIDKSVIHKLLHGKMEPDGYIMRTCAEAFGKHPSYFLEWRILFIIQTLVNRMEWSPETSIDLFREFEKQSKEAA